jgi:FkbM family methyltransferase
MEKTKYYNEIKIWDEHSKMHIYSATGILISKLKDKKDLVVVDVGANSGTYFDELNKSLDIKRAILFEVHPELYKYLDEKYSTQSHITVENIAMSDRVKGFTINDSAFQYEIENSVGTQNYNLGLSKINYDENSNISTNFFDNIKHRYNLEKIDILKIDTETEDLLVLKGFTETIKNLKQKPIIEFENNWWEKYTYEESQKLLDDFCDQCGYINDIDLKQRGDHFLYPKESVLSVPTKKQNVTMVTGLWDMGRGNLEGWAKRDFEYYKNRFFEFLETDVQMCIWIPKDLEDEVLKIRGDKPTKIFIKNLDDFKTWNPFYDKIQEIRNTDSWRNFAGWLGESPQASLEYYNPMMFTKMFMLNDSVITNPFDSEYFFWIDGGLTNTVSTGYFKNEKVLDNLENYMESLDKEYVHITYPYTSNDEIHGFERNGMAKYCDTDYVNYVARGGFFGGQKNTIGKINELYYNVMSSTLNENLMGADECLFTILCHRYPELIHRFEIEGNGLVWPFFENLMKFTEPINLETKIKLNEVGSDVGLYVITFNSPKQLETLIDSMLEYDPSFITKTKKFLLNNSTDLSTTERYEQICGQFGFEHIKKDNIGITGGRQFIAEHFNEQTNLSHYYFFEDDMFFYNGPDFTCKNGFNRKIKDIYNNTLKIIKQEKLDFLKLNFTEFYGSHVKQWAWYNVPQTFRESHWPNNPKLPELGLDPNSPNLEFKHINSFNGIPYATGEIYLCNWPIIMSREGNYKCYLKTKYKMPYEQTLMSHCYQETVKGNIKGSVLLATPTDHNRFDFYDGKLRKEC